MQRTNPFPSRLKEARGRIGISQKELGIRIGLDPSSASGRMNHYEKGRHMPDFETMERMAKELGVPVAYFFCHSETSAKIFALLESMTEEQRLELLKSLEAKYAP